MLFLSADIEIFYICGNGILKRCEQARVGLQSFFFMQEEVDEFVDAVSDAMSQSMFSAASLASIMHSATDYELEGGDELENNASQLIIPSQASTNLCRHDCWGKQ